MNTLTKNGKTITYTIIPKDNKKTYFRVKQHMVVVTTHPLAQRDRIERFILDRFDMFYEKTHEVKHEESDDEITLWGKMYTLILTHGAFKYTISEDVIYLSSRQEDMVLNKKRIYFAEMEKILPLLHQKIDPKLMHLGLSPLPIKLKNLKSKFGSYHIRKREITLNIFLSTLDPIYLEYVLYHEYAHVIEFNHSKAFYHVLDQLMPNHHVYQKDLKKIAIH
ncbi:MAG TPA: DUF45 domain-containing protein [Acholeplasmataceae bacterium]|nr:DUF45 domain-containing protein [Acholeplasmataceae bacterium]